MVHNIGHKYMNLDHIHLYKMLLDEHNYFKYIYVFIHLYSKLNYKNIMDMHIFRQYILYHLILLRLILLSIQIHHIQQHHNILANFNIFSIYYHLYNEVHNHTILLQINNNYYSYKNQYNIISYSYILVFYFHLEDTILKQHINIP